MLLYFYLRPSLKENQRPQGHLAIQRSSEIIDLEEIADGILYDKWGIWTINNESLSLLSKGSYTKMSRSKNETWFPWRSTSRSNLLHKPINTNPCWE